jgi:glyoxylase-like metal-dependent hydrolase (beta-lactamase superfamily II)
MTADRLYTLNTGHWTFDFSMAVQMTNLGEPYAGTCPVYLIDHPEGTVLFDTGLSYDMQTDPMTYGPDGAPHMTEFVDAIEMDESQRVTHLLEDVGYSPADVDVVVMSHLHTDHAGNLDVFVDAGAEIVVQKDELRYAWAPDGIQRLFYLTGDLVPLRRLDADVTPVDGEYDVFGDGSIVAFPTPGHSPGHQSLQLELPDAGTVILAADAANHRQGYEEELAASFAWNLEASIDSIHDVKHRERTHDADVYVHHDPDDIGSLPAPPNALE